MGMDMAFFVRPERKQVFHAINFTDEETDINLLLENIQSKIYPFVATSKKCVIFNEETDRRSNLFLKGLPYRILVVPIIIKTQVKAILLILKHEKKTFFTNSDRNLIKVMASQASIIIQNQYMYSELQLFTEQMSVALIESIDAKDPYTRGHSDRVNSFSVEIGRVMGLSEADLRILYWASLLHDLGKIGVPDKILTKPSKLTKEEYALLKMHTEQGYNILKYVKYLEESLPGIRHHHERYDGKGYPNGLEGEKIPLHARIIAVADTYDAMTSTRSYRPSYTHEEAMNEIEEVAGTQLDQEIVNAWIQVIENRQGIF
jgi:HD-GYP domain-containing protein (c-di-GMP phosphodiesterase class II)